MITLGERFPALAMIKAQVAQADQARDLDAFLGADVDPVPMAERSALEALTAWATDTGPEASVRLLEAVMSLHAARGGR
jgi:hypothetical protein